MCVRKRSDAPLGYKAVIRMTSPAHAHMCTMVTNVSFHEENETLSSCMTRTDNKEMK